MPLDITVVKQYPMPEMFLKNFTLKTACKRQLMPMVSQTSWSTTLFVFLATGETQDYPVDVFDETLRMNIRSAFLMTKYALRHLQKTRGNVVSAGSEAGYNGLAYNTTYGGTKGWMHSFMLGVAVEQAKHGVRANCVCPGAIDTAWTHKEDGPMNAKMEKNLIEATPLARHGTPEEIANVYAFIASVEASYVTGALWLADGGVTTAKGAAGSDTPLWLRS